MAPSPRLRVTIAEQPAAARLFVRTSLAGWNGQQVIDDAELLVSELVTNAFRHAGAAWVAVSLTMNGDRVRIGVRDSSPSEPAIRTPGEVGGFGMNIIDRVSELWGVDHDDAGKTVWFELLATGADSSPTVRP